MYWIPRIERNTYDQVKTLALQCKKMNRTRYNDTEQYNGTGMEGLPIYDAAHDAFMTLPPHTYRRGVEECGRLKYR